MTLKRALATSLFVTVGCQGLSPLSEIAGEASADLPLCHPDTLATLPARMVFDGTEESLHANWHSWGKAEVSENWMVVDAELRLRAGIKFDELVLNGAYENFVLTFEWAVSEGGNSGVKYNVREASGEPVGFEYQILDDERHPDANMGRDGNRKTAALYDILGPSGDRRLEPPGQFNRGCIAMQDRRIEHWLNGAQVLAAELDDPDFQALVAVSKFRNFPNYLVTEPAQIFLQDHGDAMRFRDIAIRPL